MNTEHWRCPKCRAILRKQTGSEYEEAGAIVLGEAACASCGATVDQADIYVGRYDVPPSPAAEDSSEKRDAKSIAQHLAHMMVFCALDRPTWPMDDADVIESVLYRMSSKIAIGLGMSGEEFASIVFREISVAKQKSHAEVEAIFKETGSALEKHSHRIDQCDDSGLNEPAVTAQAFETQASEPTAHLLAVQLLRDRAICRGQVVSKMTSDGRWVCGSIEETMTFLQERLPKAQRFTFENYVSANVKPASVVDLYGALPGVDVRSQEELESIFRDQRGWNRFRGTFPRSHGIVEISAPGFSHDGMQGMIHLGEQLGDLAGDGVCYLYEFGGELWKRQGEFRTWVS